MFRKIVKSYRFNCWVGGWHSSVAGTTPLCPTCGCACMAAELFLHMGRACCAGEGNIGGCGRGHPLRELPGRSVVDIADGRYEVQAVSVINKSMETLQQRYDVLRNSGVS